MNHSSGAISRNKASCGRVPRALPLLRPVHGTQRPRRGTRPRALPLELASHAPLMTLNIGELFQGVGSLMPGEIAAAFSAIVALGSVSLNLWGGILSERKRADLQKEFMRERLVIEQNSELRSIVARYRGPLLEATVDLEQRLYHLITGTGEWGCDAMVCEEELIYTLFTMSQFLGFVEVVRREGPRERSFLQQGNPQGTDTLNCLVEGFRFAMAAHADALEAWGDEGDVRDHPGSRRRSEFPARAARQRAAQILSSRASFISTAQPSQAAMLTNGSSNGNGNGVHAAASTSGAPTSAELSSRAQAALQFAAAFDAQRRVVSPDGLTRRWTPMPSQTCIAAASGVFDSWEDEDGVPGLRPATETFRISRGCQRAIGSMMIVTPVGASRHYTQSYGDFYARFRTDPYFAGWLKPLYEDMLALVSTSTCWDGRPAFPINRWTRLLLLQQLCVDTIDLLDPSFVRVPENRRVRLAPLQYAQLPHYEEYRQKLESMEMAHSLGYYMDANKQPNALQQASSAMATFFKYMGVAATGIENGNAGAASLPATTTAASPPPRSLKSPSRSPLPQLAPPPQNTNGTTHSAQQSGSHTPNGSQSQQNQPQSEDNDSSINDDDWPGGGGNGGGGGGGDAGWRETDEVDAEARRRRIARRAQRAEAKRSDAYAASSLPVSSASDLWPRADGFSMQPAAAAMQQQPQQQFPMSAYPTPGVRPGAQLPGFTAQGGGSLSTNPQIAAAAAGRAFEPGPAGPAPGGMSQPAQWPPMMDQGDMQAASTWKGQGQRASPVPGGWVPGQVSFAYPTDSTSGIVSQGISPEVLGEGMASRITGMDQDANSPTRGDGGARAAMKALDDIIERNWDSGGHNRRGH